MTRLLKIGYSVFTALIFSLYISYQDIPNLSSLLSFAFIVFNFIFISVAIKTKVDRSTIVLFFTIIFFSIYLITNNSMNGLDAISGAYWWLLLSFLILLDTCERNLKLESLAFVFISIMVLSFDAYYRFFLAEINFSRDTFYAFKYGLIGQDSNFAGVFCVVCLSLTLLLYKERFISKSFYITLVSIIMILTCLTFSRAAIMSMFFVLLLYHLNKWFLIVSLCTIPFFIFSLLHFFFIDPSAESKLELLYGSIDVIYNYNFFELFFGVGLGNSRIGELTPHILILQLLLDLGLVGMLLYLSIWAAFFYSVRRRALYLAIPYGLVSLSVSPLGLGVLSYCMWLFVRISRVLNQREAADYVSQFNHKNSVEE